MKSDWIESKCEFSKDERYRYMLLRRWAPGGKMVNFIMLNPSTADGKKNDPTVERCEQRARRMGFNALVITNIFALRSTNPKGLEKVDDPVGEGSRNSMAVWGYANLADMVICGWGTHGSYIGQSKAIRSMLAHTKNTHHLGLTKGGEPKHPLYISYKQKPVKWSLS